MLFMLIERFRGGDAAAVYRRYRERGRMMPEGLSYVDSWVERDFGRCFQLMECDDPRLLQEWMSRWEDLVEFEVFPVVTSKEAAEAVVHNSDAHVWLAETELKRRGRRRHRLAFCSGAYIIVHPRRSN